MDKRLAFYNMSSSITFDELPIVFNDPPKKDVLTPADQLLDMIYTRDPNTGLPVGDLSFYFNKDSNAEVKNFIEKNLLLDVSDHSKGLDFSTEQMNSLSKHITDDDIVFFSRSHDETREQYASRVQERLNGLRREYQLKRQARAIADRMRRRNESNGVSSTSA